MLMPRLTKVFASRWAALWWAAGIVLLAAQFASTADDLPQAPKPAPTAAANPWAADPPKQDRT